MAIAVCATSVFVWIAENVVTGGRMPLLDNRTAQWLHLHSGGPLRELSSLISLTNSTWAISCYATIAGAFAFTRRRWRTLATLVACVAGGLLLNEVMKLAFRRPRPVFNVPFATLASYSFPSGHVCASTVFYALAVAAVFARTPSAFWRTLAVPAALVIVSLVAVSRMVLGLHYLTDVGAAFAEGMAWFAFCLAAQSLWHPRTAT